jgi:hypothetical protein
MQQTDNHSLRKDFTGFTSAARTACTLTTTTVINSAPTPAAAKIHHGIVVRY